MVALSMLAHLAQQARVDWVASQMEGTALHGDTRRDELLAAYATRQELLTRRARIVRRRSREEKASKKRANKQDDEVRLEMVVAFPPS